MKNLTFLILFGLLISIPGISITGESQTFHPQRIIIKFKTGSSILGKIKYIVPKTISGTFESNNVSLSDPELNNFFTYFKIKTIKAAKPGSTDISLPGGIERIFIAEIENGASSNDVINSFSGQTFIEYAEKDYIATGSGKQADKEFTENSSSSVIPNDPNFNQQWGLRNTGQTVNGVIGVPGADINIAGGWDITTGSSAVKIAILDSGIPLGASEFSGRILPGYDFANNDNDPTDDQGHGTNVTSIAAAKGNNSSLIAGVNWNCKIIPVKVLDANNSGQYSWIIAGIIMAADSGAQVLNMSLGGGFSQGLQDAVTYAYSAGSIVVACMMNNNNNVPYYPAAFDNVIAIGAINNQNKRAVPFCWGGGSSYGSHIDFCAPGEMILGVNAFNTNQTSYWCGTSQATPMVSGLISLMLGLNPNLNFNQVYDLIKQNAVDRIGPPAEDSVGFDSYFGWGRINAHATLNSVPVSVINYSSNIPDNFSLHQNFPNPFNPVTKIRFDISSGDKTNERDVKLVVYDALGKEVVTLVNEKLSGGSYEVNWNAGKNSSGIYFYTLSAGDFNETKKMTVIK